VSHTLRDLVLDAKEQILAFDAKPTTKKIAYVIVNFDDHLHEYAHRYHDQIKRYISEHPTWMSSSTSSERSHQQCLDALRARLLGVRNGRGTKLPR
jgi:hypothetical protein